MVSEEIFIYFERMKVEGGMRIVRTIRKFFAVADEQNIFCSQVFLMGTIVALSQNGQPSRSWMALLGFWKR